MKRIEDILEHPLFQQCLKENEKWEAQRPFCHHNLDHLIDVARIAYAMALEMEDFSSFSKGLGHCCRNQTKEVIYAAAILHDMGKWKQYEEGLDHAIVGAHYCENVLMECGFTALERESIAEAIRCHRHKWKGVSKTFLGSILALADFHSRLCFRCAMQEECNWPERKQRKLIY
ncbi:HD domain-containing protein [Heliorestis convoluta]|uniref:HD domain-containing protein n=1 Tax=Heliorestis convoluta TaxID=356322 RepID=A0A5Q2N5X7_9FIRM|nr:HD domain-containing protein [Heliorestis convoluta]QGG48752.1 HD domain-containing protein [Heliorestis convoluta]